MSPVVFARVVFNSGVIGWYLAEYYCELDGREIDSVSLVSTDPVEQYASRAMESLS